MRIRENNKEHTELLSAKYEKKKTRKNYIYEKHKGNEDEDLSVKYFPRMKIYKNSIFIPQT
jgi:hypothetical protein